MAGAGLDCYGTGVDLLRLHAQGQHPNNDGEDGAQGEEKWEGGGGSQDSESGLNGRLRRGSLFWHIGTIFGFGCRCF